MTLETDVLRIGDVRRVAFTNDDGNEETRFVALVVEPDPADDLLEVVLVGEDEFLAGTDDVILRDDEAPAVFARVLQVSLRFPMTKGELSRRYSVLHSDTLLLAQAMMRYSARDHRRAGLQWDNDAPLRAQHLDSEFEAIRCLSSQALSSMLGRAHIDAPIRSLADAYRNRQIRQALRPRDYVKEFARVEDAVSELARVRASKVERLAS